MPQASPVEWQINDIKLFSGHDQILGNPQWELRAWPNVWDLPLAFDENRATRWRTWEPTRAGMYVEADFDRAQSLSGAVVTSRVAYYPLPFEFYGRESGGWHLLMSRPVVTQGTVGDVRMLATRAIRAAGFSYILAYNSSGLIGAAMVGHPAEWGLEKTAEHGPEILFRVK
jgi:hypothetical protein